MRAMMRGSASGSAQRTGEASTRCQSGGSGTVASILADGERMAVYRDAELLEEAAGDGGGGDTGRRLASAGSLEDGGGRRRGRT